MYTVFGKKEWTKKKEKVEWRFFFLVLHVLAFVLRKKNEHILSFVLKLKFNVWIYTKEKFFSFDRMEARKKRKLIFKSLFFNLSYFSKNYLLPMKKRREEWNTREERRKKNWSIRKIFLSQNLTSSVFVIWYSIRDLI